jgi:7-cyano-7-deazaguanine reductase
MPSTPHNRLETFENPKPDRAYVIKFECPEFTCLCPMTGQPDFATLFIEYTPDRLCVELKSLKLYLWSFRNQGAFHEAVTNQILDELVARTQPQKASIRARFLVRGGITTEVVATYPDVQPKR